MYNSSADAILIQSRCVQSVVSLEKVSPSLCPDNKSGHKKILKKLITSIFSLFCCVILDFKVLTPTTVLASRCVNTAQVKSSKIHLFLGTAGHDFTQIDNDCRFFCPSVNLSFRVCLLKTVLCSESYKIKKL